MVLNQKKREIDHMNYQNTGIWFQINQNYLSFEDNNDNI